jgi:hypothetical protein
MGRPQKRLNSWDVIELASWGHMPAAEIAHLWKVSPSTIRRRFAPELAQAKAERALQFRQFTAEIPSREGSEAIYWESFLVAHVRVCEIQLSSTSVFARIHLIPCHGESEYSWPIRSSWPFACSWRNPWHWDEQLWVAGHRSIFFSRAVIEEVMSIRAAVPTTHSFEFFDERFIPMYRPLRSFLVRAASRHLQNVNEILDRFEAHRQVPARLRSTLESVAASLYSYPRCDGIGTLVNFIGEAESEAGKTLTEDEAGQLVREAYLVGRVLGGPF